MTETADKSKESRECGDIAKLFEPSSTVSILEPTVESGNAPEDSVALPHLDSEIHAIFGESEAGESAMTDDMSGASSVEDANASEISRQAEPGEEGTSENGALTASQEVQDVVCHAEDVKISRAESVSDTEHPENLRDHSSELPENPEVSARLTNLSLRHAGTRPAWFDFEPLALSGRTRQCRQIFWRIATDHADNRKRMLALLAPSGMGKTAFLAELYAMLEHAPHNVLTLAPGVPGKTPFKALKNILEQRFYISGDAPYDRICQFVTSAVKGIIGSSLGEAEAQEVTDGILELWRADADQPVALDAGRCGTETLKRHAGGHVAQPEKMPKPPVLPQKSMIKPPTLPPRRPIPPPLETQVTSMQDILAAHAKTEQVKTEETEARIQAIPKPKRANSVPPIAAFKPNAVKENSAEAIPDGAEVQLEDEQKIAAISHENRDEKAAEAENIDLSSDQQIEMAEKLGDETQSDVENDQTEDAQDLDTQDVAVESDLETMVLEDQDAISLCQLYDGMDMEVARRAIRLEKPLIRLLEADLKKNAQVIILDDVERFDIASLLVISRVFDEIRDVPLSIVMTAKDVASLPVCLHCCDMDEIRLRSLSDSDLAQLTHYILKKLSASREKMIVPKDMCLLIAQRSFGSPKRVQELTLKHFTPDSMMHWNDALEQLRHEPLPRELAIELVRRIRECHVTARTVLQFASYLNAPFTAATLECILASWEERESLGEVDCHQLLKSLREEGYLERAEETIGRHTPTYVFKHECERLVIAGTTPKPMRHHVYGTAAQWYALNNFSENYDESIGDLWRSHRSYYEASRYYERAAYRARRQMQLQKAWPLFRKLLKTVPADCLAQRIQYSLDGASVAFRLGHIDEAFRLCRLCSHHAIKLSAYNQAARAHVLMASMLIEIGSVRHVLRYTARANSLLNCGGDANTRCHLYNVLTRRALMIGHHQEAVKWHKKAMEGAKQLQFQPNDRLLLEWTDAEIEANYGTPSKALEQFRAIAEKAGSLGLSRLQALACRSMGNLYMRLEDIERALEALNISLGMAQEMNDVILHANLLSDISEGALVLEARRTARSTTEICLGMAQQTHQKALIARCLANTACLQISGGLYDKAMRTLRKAHKSSVTLRSVALWTRILGLLATLYAMPENPQYNPARANQIYRRLLAVYERYDMSLERARLMPEYAEFLLRTHQNMAALNIYRIARGIYLRLGLEELADKMQASIEQIMRDHQLER